MICWEYYPQGLLQMCLQTCALKYILFHSKAKTCQYMRNSIFSENCGHIMVIQNESDWDQSDLAADE